MNVRSFFRVLGLVSGASCLAAMAGCFEPSYEFTHEKTIASPDGRISTSSAEDLIFSPDGETLIAASPDQVFHFDVATGELLQAWDESPYEIRNVNLSDDGRYLMIHSQDCFFLGDLNDFSCKDSIKVIDLDMDEILQSWSLDNRFGSSADLSPDGSQIIFQSSHGGTSITEHPDGTTEIDERINPQPGRFLLDVATGAETDFGLVGGIVFLDGGSMILDDLELLTYPGLESLGEISVLDSTSWPDRSYALSHIAESDDSRYLFLAAWRVSLYILPPAPPLGRLFRAELTPEANVVEFKPFQDDSLGSIRGIDAGRTLLVSGERDTVRLWDIEMGDELARLLPDLPPDESGGSPWIVNVAIHEDSNLIAFTIYDYPNSTIELYRFAPLPWD